TAGTGPVTLIAPGGSVLRGGGASQVTADRVVIRSGCVGVAGTIGACGAPLKLNATNITAVARQSGLINIRNDPATPVVVNCLSTGCGNITFVQSGGGPLTVLNAFTGNGDISITNNGTN